MIKTIAFDCWGTLFISGESSLHPFEVFACTIGHTLRDEVYRKVFETHLMLDDYDDLKQPIRSLLESLDVEPNEELLAKLESILLGTIVTQRTFPETLSLLEDLKGRFRLVLVTNTFRQAFEGLDSKFNLSDQFDVIYTSYEFHRIKPDPDVFDELLKAAQCRPEEILMVGDSLGDDIEPALAAGMKTLLVDRRKRYLDAAVTKVDDLRDLERIISGI